MALSRRVIASIAIAFALAPVRAAAQDARDERPAFTLSSSHIFSTKETPTIHLSFRRVTYLDFRVYRVNDALKFFANLRDPHQLGSEEPIVEQEPTYLERVADWKAGRRAQVFRFVRAQFSWEYRSARRERAAQQTVQLRKTVRFNNFAQVPLLNAAQLVSSWREILPPVADVESRRVPLENTGPGVYVVEAVNSTLRAYTVVILSDIGLVTKAAPGQLLIFAANRFSGEPLPDCGVDVLAGKERVGSGRTDQTGTMFLTMPRLASDDVIAIAQCGGQITANDPGAWLLKEESRELVGYIYTDKPIYRPGHTVHTRGVLRWRRNGALTPFDKKQVEVVVSDQNDKVIARQTRPVDEFGSVNASFPVPASAALGYYTIKFNSDDVSATGSFEVQEYRKPEFEVIVKPAERFIVQGNAARVTISARYYFGQPVAGGTVKYVVHKQPYYSPLHWSDGEEGEGEDTGDYSFYGEEASETTATLTDQGTLEVSVPLDVEDSHQDYSARIEARVTDASSREVSGDTIVHATYTRVLLVGSTDRYVYAPGSSLTYTVKALDYTGVPQANQKISVRGEHLKPRDAYNGPRTSGDKFAESTVQTDGEGRGAWTVTLPKESGTYLFKASLPVGDRTAGETTWVWVSGVDTGGNEDEYLELMSDKKVYQPGDTARFAVRGRTLNGAVLITKEAQVISYHRIERVTGDSFEVPITADDIGDTHVNLAYLKDDRLFRAEKRVSVPAAARQLSITITADQPVSKPQKPGIFTLVAKDASGAPVHAQISLGVIDEAVYAVRKDDTPDPLRFFYRVEYSHVGTQFSTDYAFVGYSGRDQLLLARRRRRPLALADFKADKPVQPQVRKEFPDAIYWVGDLVTNAQGEAKVELKYPDALTTWRLTARAVTADTNVGTAVARTTTTKDLIVRVITPRFLTEGDEVAVPAIVHNYLPASKNVDLSMKATGVVPAAGGAPAADKTTVSIAQGGEHRLDYRFTSNQVGTAAFTATAITDADADAVEISLPVLPYGLERHTAQAGSINGAGEQSVSLEVPQTANPARRTISVGLAPSLAGSLLGALDFLTSFPYGCTEQTLSSFLPNVLVTRALADLKIAPTERLQVLDRQVSEGLRRLYDYQHEDGGWGWWKADRNHPFMTAYALYGLAEAKRAGYKVEEARLDNGVTALEQLYATYPRAVPDLKAYLVYVLHLVRRDRPTPAGSEPQEKFDEKKALDDLWSARERMSPYGQALLLLTLDDLKDPQGNQLASDLLAHVQTTGDLAFWRTERDPLLEDDVETSVEATAYAVKALAARDPKNPTLERAVRWLLLNRNGGWYWSSTKQTAMVLYGLLDYMRARGELGTTFAADVIVNGQPAGSHTFTAAELTSPDPVMFTAPATAGANSVKIVKRGAGSVYWSADALYYETKAPLTPTGSHQLALVRQYFTLTPTTVGKKIVYRESAFTGNAAPGDVLLVRLTVAGARDWRYLILEDPLPAGTEPIQREDSYPLEHPIRNGWWYGSEREFRDNRTVYFQESFDNGRYEYQYLLKVVTPGVFRAMPARIWPMYVPGVTASSEPQTFTIALPAGAAR